MLDFLRNLTKSAEEKRQEQLHAYVSDSLSEKERQQFEASLAADEALQAEVDNLQQMRQLLRQMPRRRAPRHFTLDPALYGTALLGKVMYALLATSYPEHGYAGYVVSRNIQKN